MTFEHFLLLPEDWIPNNPRLPVIVYRAALPGGGAAGFESLFRRNGWSAQWRAGIFDYHHYHSTAHEALGIAAGQAILELGGPQGRRSEVKAGDGVLLPVGVGHRRGQASPDFLVVGAYPPGQTFDICRSAPSTQMLKTMSAVRFPPSDPVAGAEGPVTKLWSR